MDDQTIKIISDIVLALIAVSIPPLIGVLVLWIKSKLNINQQAQLQAAVKIAVSAAELLKAKNGWTSDTAKRWVIDAIVAKFPKVDQDLLDVIIEACVAELKTGGLELAKSTKSGAIVVSADSK